tara:strand:+ start:684 stop:1298 length:615 start_codon:yes stop_codon:yes gene_type:complete
MELFKGILYRKNYIYIFFNILKNNIKKNLRFKIVNNLIEKNSTLIDVCGGSGWLKKYIDKKVEYTVSDASVEFGQICKKNKINFIKLNCKNLDNIKNKFDYSVMIISLYQFRDNIKKILKALKKISKKKIIIIEEVSPDNETYTFTHFKKKIRDYLSYTNYCNKNNHLFTSYEFKVLMKKNNFKLINKFATDNLLVAIFDVRSK